MGMVHFDIQWTVHRDIF